jgi:hypothetical protein
MQENCYRILTDAQPVLARIAELLERHGLEAILIGNAAAALQGAPDHHRSGLHVPADTGQHSEAQGDCF